MDNVIQEVRKIREAYAKQFGYDLQAIHRDLKEPEQAGGRRIVSLPPRRPKPIKALSRKTQPLTPTPLP